MCRGSGGRGDVLQAAECQDGGSQQAEVSPRTPGLRTSGLQDRGSTHVCSSKAPRSGAFVTAAPGHKYSRQSVWHHPRLPELRPHSHWPAGQRLRLEIGSHSGPPPPGAALPRARPSLSPLCPPLTRGLTRPVPSASGTFSDQRRSPQWRGKRDEPPAFKTNRIRVQRTPPGGT